MSGAGFPIDLTMLEAVAKCIAAETGQPWDTLRGDERAEAIKDVAWWAGKFAAAGYRVILTAGATLDIAPPQAPPASPPQRPPPGYGVFPPVPPPGDAARLAMAALRLQALALAWSLAGPGSAETLQPRAERLLAWAMAGGATAS